MCGLGLRRHEHAAKKIVETGEEDQRKQTGDTEHDAQRPGQVDASRCIVRFGVARLVDANEEEVDYRNQR